MYKYNKYLMTRKSVWQGFESCKNHCRFGRVGNNPLRACSWGGSIPQSWPQILGKI